MKKKSLLAGVIAMILMLSVVSSVFAASTTVTIPNLNYFVQHSLSNTDTVTFKYTNTSSITQTAIFRITNVGYNDNGTTDVAGKLKGNYYLVYANGSSIDLGTISGSNLSGGLMNYLAPNASLVVKLENANANSQVGFKIKFSNQ